MVWRLRACYEWNSPGNGAEKKRKRYEKVVRKILFPFLPVCRIFWPDPAAWLPGRF